MILTKSDDDNTADEYLQPADKRGRLQVPLTEAQISRQMRSRRRQLEILRRMIAEREGRDCGR